MRRGFFLLSMTGEEQSARPCNGQWVLTVFAAVAAWTAAALAGSTEHDGAFILRTLAVLAAVWWAAAGLLLPRWALLLPASGVLLVTVATPLSPEPGPALQAWVSAVSVVLLYVAVAGNTQRDISGALLWGLALAAAGTSVWALWEWLSGAEAPRANAGFINPNNLAAWCAPLAVWLGAQLESINPRPQQARPQHQRGHRGRQAALLLLACLLLAGIVATESRSGLLAAGLGLVAVLFARSRRAALAALLLAAAVSLATPGMRARFVGAQDPYAYARMHIWRASAHLALQAPFGVGLNHYDDAMRRHGIPLPGWVQYPKRADHGHNEALTAWVELGWAGLLLTLLAPIMLLRAMLHAFQQGRSSPSQLAADLGVGAAFVVPAALSNTLHVPVVALSAAVWAGGVTRRCGANAHEIVPRRSWGGTLRGDAHQRWQLSGRRAQRGLAVLAVMSVLAALPGLGSQWLSRRAVRLREAGAVKPALRAAQWAAWMSPWSEGAALLAQSLRYLDAAAPADVAAALMDIAQQHPYSPRALERAAWVLTRAAEKRELGQAARAEIAGLRQRVAERDPKNALAWLRAGRAWLQARAPERAGKAFARAVRVEPHCAGALAHLAQLAAGRSMPDRASRLAEHAREAHAHRLTVAAGHPRQVLSLDSTAHAALRSVPEQSTAQAEAQP